MPYTPQIHTHKCEICGIEYTSFSSFDGGMCHNYRERARQQIYLLNPRTNEEETHEPFNETELVDTLINYFVEEMNSNTDTLIDNCIETLSEISRNTYYVTPKDE